MGGTEDQRHDDSRRREAFPFGLIAFKEFKQGLLPLGACEFQAELERRGTINAAARGVPARQDLAASSKQPPLDVRLESAGATAGSETAFFRFAGGWYTHIRQHTGQGVVNGELSVVLGAGLLYRFLVPTCWLATRTCKWWRSFAFQSQNCQLTCFPQSQTPSSVASSRRCSLRQDLFAQNDQLPGLKIGRGLPLKGAPLLNLVSIQLSGDRSKVGLIAIVRSGAWLTCRLMWKSTIHDRRSP